MGAVDYLNSYDASGNIVSMNLNGTEYYYVRSAQGDITGLIDCSGTQVVSYTYDTWVSLYPLLERLLQLWE